MHVLIIGMTESGKTTLAKSMCAHYKAHGIATCVLDPLADPEWNSDFQTTDKAEFLDRVKKSRQCALFIDESGEMVGRYDAEMFWCATQARHWGHRTHFITQRAAQLSPTVRHQCTKLFVFRVGVKDAETLAEEFGQDSVLEAGRLPQFEFLAVSRFGNTERLRLEIGKGKVDNVTVDPAAFDRRRNIPAPRGREETKGAQQCGT